MSRGSVWKVKAEEATTAKTRKLLKFRSQPVNYSKMANRFTKSSPAGKIQQDGKQLFLKGQIVATDPGMAWCCVAMSWSGDLSQI